MGLLDKLFGKNEVNVVRTEVPRNTGNNSAEFEIEDIFSIAGRGTIVTGRVLNGSFKVNDVVVITSTGMECEIGTIEKFRKVVDQVSEGEHAGLLLRGIDRSDVSKGEILYK